MSSKLYFMSDGNANELTETYYEKENCLQKIIADNPRLILREPNDPDAKLLLISREFSIAETEKDGNSFYLDHLFVDQNGVPVIVEVKRSTNSQIRREVVGQILDYASRVSSLNANDLRELFAKQYEGNNEVLDGYDTDEFWEKVSICLKAERIKLVFAADKIPDTLKALIEFLDRNMPNIEVYGVEICQYTNGSVTLLSSSVVGCAPIKQTVSISQVGNEWTIEGFSNFLQENSLSSTIPVLQDIINHVSRYASARRFGRGLSPSLSYYMFGKRVIYLSVWSKKTPGLLCTAEFALKRLIEWFPKCGWTEAQLQELCFANFPNKKCYEDDNLIWKTNDYVYIDLRVLSDKENLDYFKGVVSKICEEINDAYEGSE